MSINFQEAQILALMVQAKAIEVEVIAMQANDRGIETSGAGCYTEDAYLGMAQQLHTISNDIQHIAREGHLS